MEQFTKLDIDKQAEEANIVKRFESGMVINPYTISPKNLLSDALSDKRKYNISGIPVVEERNQKLVGILTNRDIRFATNQN